MSTALSLSINSQAPSHARRPLRDRLMLLPAQLHARLASRRFFAAVRSATVLQERLLLRLVAERAESDFGRRHDLARVRNYADFRSAVPIGDYESIRGYVDRVREGDVGALFPRGQRVLMFALTSGTTAEPKYIPVTPRVLADWRYGWNVWGLRALLDHPGTMLRSIVQVTSPMDDHLAPSGIPCGAITGLLAATQKRLVRRYYAAPLPVAKIGDATAKYYTIMRLAIPRDVAFMVTANPSTLLRMAQIADERRASIIRDIRDGTLNAEMPVDAAIRSALAPLLRPDPTAAARLEILVNRAGGLYPRDYWRLGFLAHWTGGTMGLYAPQFPKWFGDVPARDIGLLASEGRLSIPIEDRSGSGVLAISEQFYEFIPAEEYGRAQASAMRSHEVQIGQEYFVVLTNASGLCRYDLGDRVRVTGRLGEAPLIEFLCRGAHTASLAGEKLTEDQVILAMRRIALDGDSETVDFVLAPQWADVPSYRLYVEQGRASRVPSLADRFDAALSAVNPEYASKRHTLRLGPPEVMALKPGALAERDRRLRASRARTSEQFKHQYLLPRPGMDEDLAATAMPEFRDRPLR